MAKASEDTEITLGTGKLLALFFGLVSLCAVFFALGFSFGRNSVLKISPTETLAQTSPAPSVLRPSALKTSTPAETAGDSSSKESSDTPAKQDSAAADTNAPAASSDSKPAPPDPAVAPAQGSYFVQVAAVSKQEDAEALVDALKKKQYPAFASNGSSDKLIHVQVGPYGDVKEAEVMRSKLTGDGYNPILKK